VPLRLRNLLRIGLAAEVNVAASISPKVLMGVRPMVRGFLNAADRLDDALARCTADDPDDVYIALGEVSHWLDTIEARFPTLLKGNTDASGVIFARNRTHHHAASAVEFVSSNSWRWRAADLLPSDPEYANPAREKCYREQLEGKPVGAVFTRLRPVVQSLIADS
jgi:hypothetical protein